MFYGQQVADTRTYFFSAWSKHLTKQPLTPLEAQLLAVILQHPEYHPTLSQQNTELTYHSEFGMDNPFLHMGLHLTLQDQITLNRPQGIQTIFQALLKRHGDRHHVEHLCMEQLAITLWNAQRNQSQPDEQAYLTACRRL